MWPIAYLEWPARMVFTFLRHLLTRKKKKAKNMSENTYSPQSLFGPLQRVLPTPDIIQMTKF